MWKQNRIWNQKFDEIKKAIYSRNIDNNEEADRSGNEEVSRKQKQRRFLERRVKQGNRRQRNLMRQGSNMIRGRHFF